MLAWDVFFFFYDDDDDDDADDADGIEASRLIDYRYWTHETRELGSACIHLAITMCRGSSRKTVR